ncbi:MarR family transcriptional regulator [Nocardia sp. NPDC059764]|uniref:MarR family transcriptional regulator n=1 Tax=Nocardia sp. NPDC059764 TaxID=3346939 RepID=UPI003661760C
MRGHPPSDPLRISTVQLRSLPVLYGVAISLSQVSILKRLDRDGPATVADLARADKIRHQSVATAASTLIERALIRRTTDPTDLRRKLLELTPAGRDLLTERREAGSGHLATSSTNA